MQISTLVVYLCAVQSLNATKRSIMGKQKQVFSFSVGFDTFHLSGLAEVDAAGDVYFLTCFRQDHVEKNGVTTDGHKYEFNPDGLTDADREYLEHQIKYRHLPEVFQINGISTVYDITYNRALPTHTENTPHPGFQVVRSIRHIGGQRIRVVSTGSLEQTLGELKAAVIF